MQDAAAATYGPLLESSFGFDLRSWVTTVALAARRAVDPNELERCVNLDMPDMTIGLRALDKKPLDGLKEGDKVKYTANKQNGTYVVAARNSEVVALAGACCAPVGAEPRNSVPGS